MPFKLITGLGILLLTGLLVYFSAYFFSLGQDLLNGFHLLLVALMLWGWVGLWRARATWVAWAAGLQVLLTVALYVIFLNS